MKMMWGLREELMRVIWRERRRGWVKKGEEKKDWGIILLLILHSLQRPSQFEAPLNPPPLLTNSSASPPPSLQIPQLIDLQILYDHIYFWIHLQANYTIIYADVFKILVWLKHNIWKEWCLWMPCIYFIIYTIYSHNIFSCSFSVIHTQTHIHISTPSWTKMDTWTHTHTQTLPFRSWENDNKKRPGALLDPWPLIPGGLPLPTLEVEEGWGVGDKRRGCVGALRTAPSVRPAQTASWVSSPSSVHRPLVCFFPPSNKFSFTVWMHHLKIQTTIVNSNCKF